MLLKNSRQDAFVLWIVSSNIALSTLNSFYFKEFLKQVSSDLSGVSLSRFAHDLLPGTTERVLSFIKNRLRNQRVYLVVDESSQYRSSYYNLFVTTDIDSMHSSNSLKETYLIRRVTCSEWVDSDLASLITSTIDELDRDHIDVKAFALDNCSLIHNVEGKIFHQSHRPVKGVISAVHVLSAVLRELLKNDPDLNALWENVNIRVIFDK